MKFEFQVSVSIEKATGEVEAVYFQIRRGKSAKVKEYADGSAFADYNASGDLLGIEVLAPCSVKVLDKIVKRNAVVKKFIRASSPRQMVVMS